MIRLGEFNKDGYKQNFSKGELARELVYMNNDYDNLKKENKKYKEVFDKINVLLNNHDKNMGKLYYKYNNKYLLSEIKEGIRDILKEVEHD